MCQLFSYSHRKNCNAPELCQFCERPVIKESMKLPVNYLKYVCSKDIKNMVKVHKTKKTELKNVDKLQLCENCGKKIPFACYDFHRRHKCNEKIFKCDVCGKKYRKTRKHFPGMNSMSQIKLMITFK